MKGGISVFSQRSCPVGHALAAVCTVHIPQLDAAGKAVVPQDVGCVVVVEVADSGDAPWWSNGRGGAGFAEYRRPASAERT